MEVPQFAAIIDVETTGLSPYYDEIIELSIDLISFDPNSGQLVAIIDSYFGQREPSIRISPGAGAVHGLTLDVLRGKQLDHSAINRVISQADFLVAHNAAFDKGFVIQLLPEHCSKPWLCTMRDIDWFREGCTHRSLEALLDRFSLGTDRLHRATTDTAAVVALLTRFGVDGRPFLAQLLDKFPERNLQASQTGAGVLQQYLVGRQEGAERNRQWEERRRCRTVRQDEFETLQLTGATEDFFTRPTPDIIFGGKTFVFTGTFRRGPKKECADAVRALDGVVEDTLTQRTDYLIVGSLGDRAWAHGFYGTKIEKACQLYRSGHEIAIMSEDHWVREMERVTSLPATTSRLRS